MPSTVSSFHQKLKPRQKLGMLLLLLFSSVLICNVASPIDENQQRIVGGFSAYSGQFPHQVSIRWIKSETHFCGGSIIGDTWILTAARCIYGKFVEDVHSVVGSIYLNMGGVVYESSKLISHPDYHPFLDVHDIGLIKINGRITYSDVIGPISLASNNTVPVDLPCFVSGWGVQHPSSTVYSNTLQFVVLKSISLKNCQKLYPDHKIYGKQMCTLSTYEEGLCEGDVGGPLMHRGLLYGISSSYYPCGVGFPDVFTKVSGYRNWIRNVTNI